MCKKGCKKGFCSCIRTTDPGLFDHAPSIDKTARFPLRYWKAGEALHNYYLSFEDIALKVNNTPVGYVPTTSGNTTDLNTVVIDSSGDKWIIDILGNATKMPSASGTVTSFSSGNLSPLFTTSVSTPTTTPSLSFTLTNAVTQYQAFARSAAGTGVPSWVTLGLVAFTNDYNDLTNKPTIPSFTPSALTKTDDTNITLTLGGTPATALLQAVSLTLGWTGILAIARGGTGLGVLGTANQILRVNAGVTGLEYFSPTWTDNTGTVTSFSAGNLSPLFTTSVATPTTTPALSFTLSNVSQYQVFGRSAAGSGVPSWITLPSTAFTGYTAGTGISIVGDVITNTLVGKFVALADADASYQTSITSVSANSYRKNSEIYGNNITGDPGGHYGHLKTFGALSGGYAWQLWKDVYDNDNLYFRGDGGSGYGTWYQVASRQWIINAGVIGGFHAIDDVYANYSAIKTATNLNSYFKTSTQYMSGGSNSPTDGYGHLLTMGSNTSFTFQLWKAVYDGDNFYFRTNSSGWGSWYQVASRAWVISQGYSVVTPSALTRTNDTNVTLTFGGTPLTSLLQSVNISVGWSGVLSTARGGSKWTDTGSYLLPTGGNNIRTNNSAGQGWIHLLVGDATHTGRMEWYNHSSSRVGFIGYYEDRFCYFADSTYHSFEQTPVRIQSVANDNALTKFAVFGTANEIKYRDLSSIGIGSDVWRITGGNTIATSITDSIWHNANVKLGDGSSGSNSYRLQVVGTSYFTQTMLINNSTAFNALNASASPVEVFKVDSSNNWLFAASHIKVNATDIYIDQYPNTRSDSFYTVQAARLMYTDSNGKILLTDKKAFYNDHVSSGTKTQQGHAADSTWRRLTNDLTYGSISFGTQFNTNGTTFACQIPRTDQRFWLVSVIEYENQSGSSGTPVIDLQIRVNGSTTGVVFSDWSEATTGVRNTVTIQSILYTAGGGGYYDVDIYIRVATGSGSIYVNKHDTVITNVGYIPS